MSILLVDNRTGIKTSTELSGVALDLYLRENPDIKKVGIGTTANQPYYILLNETTEEFRPPYVNGNFVYNPGLVRMGIGTPDPQATLDVNGDIKFNGNLTNTGISTFQGPVFFTNDVTFDRFTVGVATITKKLDIGIGGTVLTAIASTDPNIVGAASTYYGNIGIGSTIPQQKLDIAGSIKINKNIFDSVNVAGTTGYYLSRDVDGIRWVSVNPLGSQGILVYNDLTLIGAGQSFLGINLKTGDGLGITTDTIQAFVNPSNPNIADIYVYDYWSPILGGNIYRNSNVGINNDAPAFSLDITGTANITQTLNVAGIVSFSSSEQSTTKDTGALIISNGGLGVEGNINLGGDLKIGGATQSTTKDTGALIIETGGLGVEGNINLGGDLKIGGATQSTTKDTGALIIETGGLGVEGNINLGGDLKIGIGGTVITTTGIGSVGIGTNLPAKGLDIANQVLIQKAVYDSNRNVGYKTEFYKTPRTVLGQVAVGATGEVISDRFFDAANLIRLNLDFIATEAVGFITSTDYKSPAFVVPGISSCKDDIKDILKAITLDITKGGNSQSVGAGLSYYNGASLIHITGNDVNGYSIKDATIVAITTAAQISQKVINNVLLTTSYQSGVSSIRQIRDLTIQDDASVNSNANINGCSNVVSAIFVTAGIVTAIIGGGPGAAPPLTQPDGKVVWVPPGTDVRNLVWVNKYGNDDNGGRTEGDAKLTIAAAAAVAQSGDTIMVRSGVYYENNPIGLRTDVSVTGQDLRLVTVVPQNSGKDVFHVRRGCLVENLNFACDTGQSNPGGGAVAFPPTDSTKFAVSGFIAPGPATEGPSGRWRSPYIRNCTNFMPLSIGMKIDGNHATASTIGADLKSMVCDSFTQYNEAGIGVSITNNGYAQLVSIFTINCDIAIYTDTGGQCDLTNSNSSFGNFGLVAVGLGATEFTAQVNTTTDAEADRVVFKNVTDNVGISSRRPYDGQALWFKINLSNYNTGQVGIITAPLKRLKSITVVNGGSGYSEASPPDITIFDTATNDTLPLGPEGIIAEVSPTISGLGSITSVDIVDSGRNYLPNQNIGVRINGIGTTDLTAQMEPIYFTISESSLPTFTVGIGTTTTVVLNEFIPYIVYANDAVEIRRISRILTSGHSFEYIGSGTDINISTPLKGAVPIKENEIVAIDGGQVPHTATDQKGNFNIGEGIQINQATATITGRDFSKAIQAEVTPLILALR